MLRTVLILAWTVALLFFLWEFVMARRIPKLYGALPPKAFRIADVIFGAVTVLTLYYLITDPS